MSNHMPWDHPLVLKQSPSMDDLFLNADDNSFGVDVGISANNGNPGTIGGSAGRKNDDSGGQGGKTKVALASKNAREKRKKEFETLLQENSRLREERERFLQHIEMLQQKVIEMREKEGDIDLQLENDLLKAQLSEHSMFIGGLIRMANGVPTTEAQKKQLYRQGADYAVAHITSLLSRSVRMASEWRSAKVPEGLRSMAVWYQFVTDPSTGLRRLNLRADQIIPGVSADVVSALYWSLWTSEAAVRELFEGSKMDSANISLSSRVIFQDEVSYASPNEDGEDKEESLAALYTRDDRAHHVFIGSKREQSIAKGSLALAMPGDDVDGQMIQPWKRRRCRMCARSNTNINRLQEEDAPKQMISLSSSSSSTAAESKPASDQAPLPENPSTMNNPTYIEGSVAWDLDDFRGCRIATVVSLVEGFKVGKFDAFEFITNDGWVSDLFVAFIKMFITMLRAQHPGPVRHPSPSASVTSSTTHDSSGTNGKKKRGEVPGGDGSVPVDDVEIGGSGRKKTKGE